MSKTFSGVWRIALIAVLAVIATKFVLNLISPLRPVAAFL